MQPPSEINLTAASIREKVLRRSFNANVGHIGCSLSVADAMAVLYSGFIDSADRSEFVLSKGHAALCLFAALDEAGILEEELATFCSDGTSLGVHPEAGLEGIAFSTGSLGQGLSFATGYALAGRLGPPREVYTLASDAELNEGSFWEAAMFAGHHGLTNLTLLVDMNGQQALGQTTEILDLTNAGQLFRQLGWEVHDVDGHDHEEIRTHLKRAQEEDNQPSVLLLDTTFGKGVSFMESSVEWHYRPLDEELLRQALEEVRVTQGES